MLICKKNIGCILVIVITTIWTKHQSLFVEINWLAFVKLTGKTKTPKQWRRRWGKGRGGTGPSRLVLRCRSCAKILGNFIFFGQFCLKILGNFSFFGQNFFVGDLNLDRKTVSISVKTFFWRSPSLIESSHFSGKSLVFHKSFWAPTPMLPNITN